MNLNFDMDFCAPPKPSLPTSTTTKKYAAMHVNIHIKKTLSNFLSICCRKQRKCQRFKNALLVLFKAAAVVSGVNAVAALACRAGRKGEESTHYWHENTAWPRHVRVCFWTTDDISQRLPHSRFTSDAPLCAPCTERAHPCSPSALVKC